MFFGNYKIIKNGEEIVNSNNIITEFGKDMIIKYLSSSTSSWGDTIGVGSDSGTAATSSDYKLTFEFARGEISLKSPSISTVSGTVSGTSGTNTIVFTGSATSLSIGMNVSGTGIASGSVITSISGTTNPTVYLSKNNTGSVSGTGTFTSRKIVCRASLDPSVSGVIREVGLFAGIQNSNLYGLDSKILTAFDEGVVSGDTTTWSAGTVSSTDSSIGSGNINISAGSSSYLGASSAPSSPGALNIDINGYNSTDSIQLAYKAKSSATGTVTITLYDNQSTPQTLTWSIPSQAYTSGTNYVKTSTIGSLTNSGSFNGIISAIKIANATVDISYDALKIDDTDGTETLYGLVSRSVLSTEVTKTAGDSLDIQYELTLGI